MRQLLVAHERLDDRVLDGAQRRAPGVGHLDPGPPQRGEQVGAGVRVEAGRVEDPAYVVRELLQQAGPGPARRPWSEQVGQQRLVDVDPPRHAGMRHLGRHERAGGLRRDQQPEPGGLG